MANAYVSNVQNGVIRSAGSAVVHDSAEKHVSGSAPYVDDIQIPENTLHVAFTLSKVAAGKINTIDITQAKKAQGVKAILLAEDIKHLYIGAVVHDEPLLAKEHVLFYGQALCAVLADNFDHARQAAALVEVDVTAMPAVVTIEQALAQQSFIDKSLKIETGDCQQAIANATHTLSGIFNIGGQEHFYLESQAALAIPAENQELVVYSSTQNPAEVQHLIADVLGLAQHAVEVITRRMGGGFGGKETDSSQLACICALFAQQTQCAVKARLPRYEDFLMTGKRHDYRVCYEVGFDEMGRIEGIDIDFAARCGYSLDLSKAIVYRTLFHADNAYYFKNARFQGHLCKTNTVSNTAFRGFGGPQGMLATESIIEDVAQYLKKDALLVRQLNFYQKQAPKNQTPYAQTVTDNIINELSDELVRTSNYHQRRQAIDVFNQKNKHFKRGLALSPVKFGISFTTTFLNQAGALVHVYKDGSVYLNHGGTEMGQGLFIKVCQVVASEFGIDVSRVKSSATSTAKIPNTSATAASSGSDMNGMAAREACLRIKRSLVNFASEHFSVKKSLINFQNSQVHMADKKMAFDELIKLAYMNRVELFSNGFYKTPKIHYDDVKAKGRPFYYYAYGACVSEVLVDTTTGEYKLMAVDILHDVGKSLNPAIDKGQIVGGFIQGMGWLCSEELVWNDKGVLLTSGPATYKIPAIGDTPQHFNVNFKEDNVNNEQTIYRSKAVGEPPLMLAISAWLAIKNAIFNANSRNNEVVKLAAPAGFEQVFFGLKNRECSQ